MSGRFRCEVTLLLFSIVGAARTLAAAPAVNDAAAFAPDRVIVKLRENTAANTFRRAQPLTATEWTNRLGLPVGVTLQSMRRAQSGHTVTDAPPDLSRPAILYLNGRATVPEALARLRVQADVEYVEPDYIGSGSGRPSDPDYGKQWHHQKIQSEAAWDTSAGTTGVIVAVLDSGLNASLAEFAGRLLPGHDYANNDSNPADDHGHGTAVTGLLAANANNGVLGTGVNWHCRILPYKVFDNMNRGYYSWWDQAIYDATDAGAKVINLSGGGSSESAATTAAIDYAITRGVIFITVTGNESAGVIQFPGRLPQCITLGGTERDDTRASFSNYGSAIDLVAPARDMYTVGSDGGLQYWYGTSFAAPLASGVAAIIAGFDPTITQSRMERLLSATAQDRDGGALDTAGWDPYFGFGRLDAKYAVELAATRSSPPQPINLSSRIRVGAGEKAMIGGFIITGAHAKDTLVRGIGPSLGSTGVRGALENPTLELRDAAGALIAANENWGDSQRAEIEATGVAPRDEREAAIARILQPGAYTAIVRDANGTGGVGLVELYDLQQTANSKLANVSTRGSVETGDDVMIGGFIVGSTSSYVVRALGPSLGEAGISAPLADPILQLRDRNGNLVVENDGWTQDMNAIQVVGMNLTPDDKKECAVFRSLAAGGYTAVVRGVNGTSGIGLVEVYSVRDASN